MAAVARSWRIEVAVRAVAAIFGSYALAAAIAFAVARLLPIERVEAMTVATLVSYLAIPAGAVWAFAARTPWLAWAGLALPVALLAAAGWIAGPPR